MYKDDLSPRDTMVSLLLVTGAIIASFTASSGPVQWMDNGMFLAEAAQGHYFTDSLGPLDHPFYHTFTTLIHSLFGSLSLSLMNSALLIPLAGVLYWLSRSLGANQSDAWLGTAAGLLAHSIFWVSTKAEVYILHALCVILAYALYVDDQRPISKSVKLLLVGLLTGIAASIHQLTFVVLLPLYLQALWQHRLALWVALPGFALGFSTAYPGLFEDIGRGMSLIDIGRHYLTGKLASTPAAGWEGSLLRFDSILREKSAVILLLMSLLGPQLLGLILFPNNAKRRLVWFAVVMNFIFAISYDVNDRFTFFLPGVLLAAVLGIFPLKKLLARFTFGESVLRLSVLASPVTLLAAWLLYSQGVLKMPQHSEALPFRNDIHYFMVPYLRDISAMEFIDSYEHIATAGALVISDWTPMGALRSAQAMGKFQGRTLQQCGQTQDVDAFLHGEGAFLPRTSYCADIQAEFQLDKVPVGYQLQSKSSG